jgi:hypothetical protein
MVIGRLGSGRTKVRFFGSLLLADETAAALIERAPGVFNRDGFRQLVLVPASAANVRCSPEATVSDQSAARR